METIAHILFLLLAIVVSRVLARISPILEPLPLVQIALARKLVRVADLQEARFGPG